MDLEKVVSYVANRTAYSLRQTFFDYMAAKGHDLTPEEGTILNQLWNEDGLQQSALLAHFFKGPSTLSRQLSSLERKGFILRQPVLGDRRSIRIFLTVKGREMEDEFKGYAEQLFASISRDIPEEEINRVIDVLNQLRNNALLFSKELAQ